MLPAAVMNEARIMNQFDVKPKTPEAFQTVHEALTAAAQTGGPSLIRLFPGVYQEQVTISQPGIRLMGMGKTPADTVITGNLSAKELLSDGTKRGTFRTYTLFADSDSVTLENLTVENTAGPGEKAGQAIALYADGNGFHARNCRFLGHQDTLFTAPLPEKEIEPGGFRGPKEKAPRRNQTQYYENCWIEGGVDFVFGGAAAYFEGCTFCSNEPGFVFAPSTPQGRPYGYVCRDCRFVCTWNPEDENGCPSQNPRFSHHVYLGRPWRDFGKTVLISCWLGNHIHPSGWDDWGKAHARSTVFFAEYGCLGPGSFKDCRPDWIRSLTKKDLPFYEKEQVLSEAFSLL